MNSVFGVHVFCLYLYLFIGYSYSGATGGVIGVIREPYGLKKTYFTMNLENFDNDTEVNCVTNYNIPFRVNKLWDIIKFRIQVLKNTNLSQSEDFEIQHFSLDQNVIFSCRQYIGKNNKNVLDTRIGLINITSNKIQTFKTKWAKRTFSMNYNSTVVLCCIQYQVQRTRDEVTITRYVRKKTLLVYDENYRYDNDQEAWLNMEDSQQIYIYIIAAVALIVLLLILISVVIYRKCSHKRNGGQTNGMNSSVLYADLDLQTQGSPPRPPKKEESPYACIIGELGFGSKPKQ
ncbi:uncharacterized protein LOC124641299 isoform X2 [Helicoverpa zea]|uniref:uncharacterized protein LOC124641299 isoform X2 n=1 Tax=Helicoverpa zea TaxID=7113 RepID=UPI001F5AA12F|nr:uncharacterized protein LOC124641299 isoform X2 [Helicoverpa zea]